jgi:radical SAM-linked protein
VARQPDGPPPPPIVQRLAIRYAKRGRLRFTSHRDFARAFERALRRAAIPMAYSAGFTPHPKISWVGAAPTGVASEAEYVEIGLAEAREPEAVRRDLDAALPPGLDVVEVVETAQRGLAERVEASRWCISLPQVAADEAASAVAALLALETAPVERLMKDGRRIIDARAAILAMTVGASEHDQTGESDPCATIDMVVRHTTPAVRPDDVLTALRQASALSTPVTPMVTRLAQGLLGETPPAPGELPQLTDPLVPDAIATGLPPA